MRAKLFFFCACLLAGSLGGYAWNIHRARTAARTIYFKIAPVDPRALLAGDYMSLRYDFEDFSWKEREPLTVYIGQDHIVRKDGPGEELIIKAYNRRYRLPHQFYFQEGTGKKYEQAKYAEISLLPNGALLIKQLTDENLRPLGGENE